jgi:hypothetical protein
MYSPSNSLAFFLNSLILREKEQMEMNWAALGVVIPVTGAVIGTIFAIGAFYGRAHKSNSEIEKRMDLLEELVEDRFEKVQNGLTELRIEVARREGSNFVFQRGHSKPTHRGE